MSKSSYREYFANVQKYVKMTHFLKIASVQPSNYSWFMKGSAYDHLLSLDKLAALESAVKEVLLEIV